MKKVLVLGLVALCAVGFAYAGGQQSAGGAKKVTITVGSLYGLTHPVEEALDNVLKKEIESKTKGGPVEITVDVQHNAVLGNEQGLWDQVRGGSLQLAVVGTGGFLSEWPQALISDWPFLYRDLDHAKKVWASPVATELNDSFHQKIPAVYMLAWGPNSARTFTSNKKLTGVDDFKGQKFRMPGNPIHVGIVENLGASAQVIPLNELFSALETGVVDGQDNGMTTVIANHFEEVQKYLYETNHITATLEIVANAGFLDQLPAETQTIIRDAALKTMQTAWDTYLKSLDTDRAYLVEHGVTVTPCTSADQERIIQLIKPLTDKLYADNTWAPSLIDKVKAVQ